AAVIIACLEMPLRLLLTKPGGNRKGADIIGQSCFERSDEVSKSRVCAVTTGLARDLLAQGVKRRNLSLATVVGKHVNIVASGIGRPEADDGVGRQPFFGNDTIKQRACVVEQLPCFGSNLAVCENGRIATG